MCIVVCKYHSHVHMLNKIKACFRFDLKNNDTFKKQDIFVIFFDDDIFRCKCGNHYTPGFHKHQVPSFYTKDPVRLLDFESCAPVSLPERQKSAKITHLNLYELLYNNYYMINMGNYTSFTSSPSNLNFLGILLRANLQPL